MATSVSTLWQSPRWRLAILVALVNLFVFALVAVSLQGSYQQYLGRAALTSRNTNRLVSQSIASDIDRIDLALRTVVDEVQRQSAAGGLDPPALKAMLERLHDRLPMVDGVTLVDAGGNMTLASKLIPANVNVADRPFFIRLRTSVHAGLVISPPIVGRASHKSQLVFGRRLLSAEGRFMGAVFAPIPLDWFLGHFISLEVGPNGVVVLRGDASRDFELLSRYPAAGFVGQTKVSDTFRATIAANPRQGTYQARAGADDVLRTFSYAAVGEYPLITLVGLAVEDYLVDWWDEVFKLTALAACFSLGTIFGGVALHRTWRVLEQRTEELARSNADLEQFAYVASHDLQTPLRNIASFTQLLERRYRGRLDGDADEFIAYIVDGAKRMSQMVSDLLDYARLSTVSRQPVTVDLAAVAAVVLQDLRHELTTAEADVTVGALPVVAAEALQMERLFRNLLENCLRYRHPDRPLRIVISAQPEPDGRWRLAVRDNGVGVDPEYHERVFVLFQRLEPAKYPAGTGMGLAICRRIVYRFGGRIWIESLPDQGAAVLFTLPAAVPGSGAAAAAAPLETRVDG
jgi:signal transduction histidine kinase